MQVHELKLVSLARVAQADLVLVLWARAEQAEPVGTRAFPPLAGRLTMGSQLPPSS